jgi:glycosyltransferase involved in cell wall biosynthesis
MFNFYAPINNTGYGIHGSSLLEALYERGTEFGCLPVTVPQFDNEKIAKIVTEERRVKDYDAPTVVLWHPFDVAKYRGKPLIAYIVFETTKFKENEIENLKAVDAILVASEWAKQVVLSHEELKDKPVEVVPEGVDPLIFTPEIARADSEKLSKFIDELANADMKRFKLLSIGKYEARKGIDLILELMHNRISSGITPLCLIAMWDNPFIKNFFFEALPETLSKNGFFEAKYENIPQFVKIYDHINGKGNRIIALPRVFQRDALPEVFKLADLAVFPTRAEGWNLPLIECLSCGVRAVATNYSGQTEYLKEPYVNMDGAKDVVLLNNLKMEVASDDFFFRGDCGEWATPDIEEFVSAVQEMITDGPGKKNCCWKEIHKSFSWDASAKKLEDAVSKIVGK